jgi:hypothetical protein
MSSEIQLEKRESLGESLVVSIQHLICVNNVCYLQKRCGKFYDDNHEARCTSEILSLFQCSRNHKFATGLHVGPEA